jgi:hypothetical protein
MVHVEGDFFGVTYDTPLRIEAAVPAGDDPEAILQANALQLRPLAGWVDVAAEAVHLDDYGRLRLIVTAVDDLGLKVVPGSASRTVHEAVSRGAWTAEDRRLAVAGGLRAAGYAVSLFEDPRGELLLGVGVGDDVLNVHSVTHSWAWVEGGQRRETEIRWVLWDGSSRMGDLPDGVSAGNVRSRRGGGPPSGRVMSLAAREVPAFVLRRGVPATMVLDGTGAEVAYTRRPDAAAWLSLYPELKFEHQVSAARRELKAMGLDVAIREAARRSPDEVALVDTLIRSVQRHFTYRPGPVRSLHELAADRFGDCDGLSSWMAAMLLELGWTADDVVALSFGDHLALAVRPRRGSGPDGGVGIELQGDRYSVVDVTNYVHDGQRLVSRWGASGHPRGRSASVLRLDTSP